MLPAEKRSSRLSSRPACVAVLSLMACATARGSSYSMIYLVGNTGIGGVAGDMVGDTGGHIFGSGVGYPGFATGGLFRLSAPAPGSSIWTGDFGGIFQPGGSQGSVAYGGPTIVAGSVFGVSTQGGTYGFGAVVSDSFLGNKLGLHDFGGQSVKPHDGANALAGMIEGPSRLLYGTTNAGGDGPRGGAGTIFSISPSVSRPSYHVLHRFGATEDGANPGYGRLALDPAGRLFGTTQNGGAAGQGTAYMLQRVAGKWQEQVIYSFAGAPGLYGPVANVAQDSAGNLYGCASGGAQAQGAVYKLSPPAQPGGQYTQTTLYTFGTAPNDPVATSPSQGCGVSYDAATGRLYGTSWAGGTANYGTIWELDPPASGQATWTETIIHSFSGAFAQGEYPVAEPVLIGAAWYGGTSDGIIYQFTP